VDIEIPFGERPKYFSTTLAPLFDPNGQPYRVLAIGQDVSELMDKNEKIDKINDELKEKISEISQQNELLNFQQKEIFDKSEELKLQSEEIKAINESLEQRVKERTQVLEEKNKQLAEYAFINSHVLRAPVSTMMGLINLISYSTLPLEDQKIYDHLLETAEVLDAIIFKINNAIDNGAHFDRNYLEPEREFHPMR
jgi:signal transduction histidine kinase